MSNKVVVEYDYTAKEPDELTIRKGDVIADVSKKPGGWWEGTLRDKTGMFPDNFVRSLDKDAAVVMRNPKDATRIRQCRAVFSYDRDHEDELSLKVGDIVDITGEEEEGWWRGVLHGKEGVFPSNFVKELTWQPSPSLRVSGNLENGTEHKPPKLPAKPSKQLCEATFPYKAQNEDELSFREGDIIAIVSKECADPGWWLGEIDGKTGVFPDNFVTPVTDSKINRKSTLEKGAIKSVSVASQRKSIEVKKEPESDDKKPSPGTNKPSVLKKSPGFLTEIKKKIEDTIDGALNSKIPVEDGPAKESNAFDNVERRPLLTDVRATRAKAPGRRPPTSAAQKDETPAVDEPAPVESPPQPDDTPAKPKLREWEKHKAPWLEEMKLNQVRRTLVIPSVDENSNDNNEPPHKTKSPLEEAPVDESSKRSPEDKQRSIEYVLERLEQLEGVVRKQARLIEEMQEKLQKLQA